jgi:hypothetical protein
MLPRGSVDDWHLVRRFGSSRDLPCGIPVAIVSKLPEVVYYFETDCLADYEFETSAMKQAATSACSTLTPHQIYVEIETELLKINAMGWPPNEDGQPCITTIHSQWATCWKRVRVTDDDVFGPGSGYVWVRCPTSYSCCDWSFRVCIVGGVRVVTGGIRSDPRENVCEDWQNYDISWPYCYNPCRDS